MRTKLFFLLVLSLFAIDAFAQTPKTISAGVLNDKAKELPQPVYPAAARAVRAGGAVNVQVTIDETGAVVSASAVSGHPLLRAASEAAARLAKFSPVRLSGQPVSVTGVIVYNFTLPVDWRGVGFALGDAEAEIDDTDLLKDAVGELRQGGFAGESKSLQTVIDNFEKDAESAGKQSSAIAQIISSLQSAFSGQPREIWNFDLGLAIGRVEASNFDEAVLRENLPRFGILLDSAPANSDESVLDALRKLSEMAGKNSFSRRDKKLVKELISDL